MPTNSRIQFSPAYVFSSTLLTFNTRSRLCETIGRERHSVGIIRSKRELEKNILRLKSNLEQTHLLDITCGCVRIIEEIIKVNWEKKKIIIFFRIKVWRYNTSFFPRVDCIFVKMDSKIPGKLIMNIFHFRLFFDMFYKIWYSIPSSEPSLSFKFYIFIKMKYFLVFKL